jgi:hypothetical protein
MAIIERPGSAVVRYAPPYRVVDDTDRAAVIDRLRCVSADIEDLDRFGRLVEEAWRATTWSELAAVAAAAPPPPPPDPSLEVVTGMLGASRRAAGWSAPEVVMANAVLGTVLIDLTEASWDGSPLIVHANALAGGVHIVVPRDVRVRVDTAGRSRAVRVSGPRPSSLPTGCGEVAVRAQAFAGSVSIRRHPFRARPLAA